MMSNNTDNNQDMQDIIAPFKEPNSPVQRIDKDRLSQSVSKSKRTIIDQNEQIKKIANQSEQGLKQALTLIASSAGSLIILGMGKSGYIGKKIAATMASTGTPSFFIHPTEALHSDLSIIQPVDVVLLISNSGETDEILGLIPALKAFGNKIIALTGNDESALAINCDAVLNVKVTRKITPTNLVLTSFTSATLEMGDTLAMGLMHLKDFQLHQFALYHPSGNLSKRLLTELKDVMQTYKLPLVNSVDSIQKTVLTMNRSTSGLAIVQNDGKLAGVITRGDISRAHAKNIDINKHTAKDIMTTMPITMSQDKMLVTAAAVMRENHIKHLLVTSGDNTDCVIGVLEYIQV